MEKANLQTLIKESEADKGIVFDSEGHVVDFYNISKENNIAAMANVILTMADEFFQDTLNSKSLNQLVLTSNDGLIIINKYDNHTICLLTNDVSKLAMIKLTLKKIALQ
ncbi:roadblock/LC7 domain-containing protein [Tenacibaculum sp. XPcli2-G]|uniref:roadblock/LC7 domain-containing protein n=1 Tax=Tenacibaculum sp. XPcli2-G TaxID=2954503 RepID=UPI00209682BB|nr:roadblock/LC7 domain-containing protein [Tenacibaculum sp. XPcli2-G]MCO7185664.1 roadblock/LC7 domain-containing protein [Tenacibaculum sp. XPcli2-G]